MAMGWRLNQLTLDVVVNPNQDPQIPAAGAVTVAVVPAAVAAKVAVDFAWLWKIIIYSRWLSIGCRDLGVAVVIAKERNGLV
jgi:hypothetical protein